MCDASPASQVRLDSAQGDGKRPPVSRGLGRSAGGILFPGGKRRPGNRARTDLVSVTLGEHLDQDVPEVCAAPGCSGRPRQDVSFYNFQWGVCHSQGLNKPGRIHYSILTRKAELKRRETSCPGPHSELMVELEEESRLLSPCSVPCWPVEAGPLPRSVPPGAVPPGAAVGRLATQPVVGKEHSAATC